MQAQKKGSIGIFDSGYGGLTILSEIRRVLPEYDYIYLGDNARAPYGVRSFDIVYKFTIEAVEYLFKQGCNLVILACNTASAKALRTIQQNDLPRFKDPTKRVLGVIRPTVENIGLLTKNGKIGIFGTIGTIQSHSYDIEIGKMYPGFKIYSHACPMWVSLVENKEASGDGADYFVKKDIDSLMKECRDIDTIILGCTHYPLIVDKIKKYLPENVNIVMQGEIIANSLKDYLIRHPEMEARCSKNKTCEYLTTESEEKFKEMASVFLNEDIDATQIDFSNI